MCDTCGCSEPGNEVTIRKPGEKEEHNHSHDHSHEHTHNFDHTHEHAHDGHTHEHTHPHSYKHDHDHHDHNHAHENHIHEHEHHHEHGTKITLEHNILQANDKLAERNRGFFEAKHILALNLVSSPGSGKTSLLERTIKDLKKEISFFIIEGDQQTMNDADRIHSAGAPVVQINTGNGCHLDADMINKAVKKLEVADNSVLVIENVGNLVCPSLFDLGEAHRVVIISVTEGDDKPIKYPTMFSTSDICIINKTDLLPYVDFKVEKAKEYALRVNPKFTFFEVSVKTGEGMKAWYEWLKKNNKKG
jgi:hydrogenase nickel incorporation protein HypB